MHSVCADCTYSVSVVLCCGGHMFGYHLRPGRLVNAIFRRMASFYQSYEDAVQKLNKLQSNKVVLDRIRKAVRSGEEKCTNIEDMQNFLSRTGVPMSKLDELSVIHVAGTKGKGSTSAMCESILRAHGFRTGLYTSPHLVAVRERIRIDGAVVSKDKFAKHFHRVYDLLDSSKAYEGDMPYYFAFLTVLAYNMFLRERVDVAIVEVGIGGIVDYTNVLRKVPVVGITSLGLDHTSILGTTLPEIAAAKAGIMKPGCEAYTVHQPPEAMEMLEKVANDVQCTLTVAPKYESYSFPNTNSQLLVDLEAYRTNASLAIQLAHSWMRFEKLRTINRRNSIRIKEYSGKIMQEYQIDSPYVTEEKITEEIIVRSLPNETIIGLRQCRWPGRYQVIETDYATFYLDGAHTKESMEICAKWFADNNRYKDKTLIFSATGDRDVEILLKPLRLIDFTSLYFVIPTAYKNLSEKCDNYYGKEQNEFLARCHRFAEAWNKLCPESHSVIKVLECVSDALIDIKRNSNDMSKLSVLISGSLHLVGASLSILDPNLSKH